jgi:hypothetical protein
MRYGRQYLRPVSGDGVHFGISNSAHGIVALSRILQDQEVLVVANTNTQSGWAGDVIVDGAVNSANATFVRRFTNKPQDSDAGPYVISEKNGVQVIEVNGNVSGGPIKVISVALEPMEVQILRNSSPAPTLA